MGVAIAALWGFAKSPAGKIIALILVAAIAGTVIYYRGKSDGAAEVGAKVNSETLKAAKESRQEGERIKREVESEPDRDLIECLRNGSC